MDNTAKKLNSVQAKPILKWAGGKTQMLNGEYETFSVK